MLRMIGLLVLVVIAIRVAAQPSSWYWLTGRPDTEAEQSAGEPSPDQIDFGVRLDEEDPLPPDVFRSRLDATERQAAELNETERPSLDVEAAPNQLTAVQDNTLGIRREELDAYYALLAQARDVPSDALERVAQKNVSFTVLMVESDFYRGKPITIQGEVKRLLEIPVAENSYGITQLYEAWLLTRDSGNYPVRVVCTSIPDGIPQGESIGATVPVRVTGYFFKRYSYASEGGLHTAPLILSKGLRWFPPQPTRRDDPGLAPYLLAVVVVTGLALALTVWRFTVSDKEFHRKHMQRILAARHEDTASVAQLEATDINALLSEMNSTESPERGDEEAEGGDYADGEDPPV